MATVGDQFQQAMRFRVRGIKAGNAQEWEQALHRAVHTLIEHHFAGHVKDVLSTVHGHSGRRAQAVLFDDGSIVTYCPPDMREAIHEHCERTWGACGPWGDNKSFWSDRR